MEEGAADRCKEALDKALHYDEHNPEALQLMASYLFSIEKTEVRQDICRANCPDLLRCLSGLMHSQKEENKPPACRQTITVITYRLCFITL